VGVAGSMAGGPFGSALGGAAGGAAGDNVGSAQGDEFEDHNHGGGSHQHSFTAYEDNGATTRHVLNDTVNGGGNDINVDTNYSGNVINSQGGDETRPKNVTVNFIIKYRL